MKLTKKNRIKVQKKSIKIVNIKKGGSNKINLSRCHPLRQRNNDNNFTCFNKSALLKIINRWNEKFINNKIVIKKSDSSNILWSKIDTKLKNKCESEFCWSNLDFVKEVNDSEIKQTFRPKMPKLWHNKPREWLSTTDINNVLRQYQDANDDFIFIGAVPIDLDFKDKFDRCIVNEICNMNIKSLLKKGIKRIGIVFNLDKHYEPGSHWVALFINLELNEIYYFDSFGFNPPKEVRVLMNRLKKLGLNFNKNITLKYNNIRHQFKNSECGVYSINFIVELLNGKKYEDLIKNTINDDDMNNRRLLYFIKE